ncbi:MAG: Hemolysin-type calcium-binding repeat 2 copies family protein [Rhodocyclaceae bacterium]|nr:MAG: Hemolysin-type calcium-binding repeat 2 copies family protein [Rhodocyclaceae bacterium]
MGDATISLQGFSLLDPSSWVPAFGNWCGSGWGGGQGGVGKRLAPGEAADFSVPAASITVNGVSRESPPDMTCKLHDFDYMAAIGQPNEYQLKLEADVRLMQRLSSMDWGSLSSEEIAYSALMAAAFAAKIAVVDIPGTIYENIKSAAESAWAGIKSMANPVDKSYTDSPGNSISCSADSSGNLVLNCSQASQSPDQLPAKETTYILNSETAAVKDVISTDNQTNTTLRLTDTDNNGSLDTEVRKASGTTEILIDRNQDGVLEQHSIETPDGTTSFYDDSATTIGQFQSLEQTSAQTFTPDAASPSATLNFTREVFQSERDEEVSAHVMRSFVGLENPLPGDHAVDAGDVSVGGFGDAEDETLAMAHWMETLDMLAGTPADASTDPGLPAVGETTGSGDFGNAGYLDYDWSDEGKGDVLGGLDLSVKTGWSFSSPAGWDAGNPDYELDPGLDLSVSTYSGHSFFSGYSYGSFNIDFSFGDTGPVVLDLDGDGIELIAKNVSRAWYDLDGKGARFHTGWVGADDGLLAIDDNGDGEISSGREIAFSLYTPENATDTDMEALATVFDTDHNNRLDANDARFSEFRLWQDANGNGESDPGEVRTLDEAGIVSVGVIPVKVDYQSGENRVLGFASYAKADGESGWAGDVVFGFEGDAYSTTVENAYMKVGTRKDESYGIGTGGALNLDMAANDLDGAMGVSGNDTLMAGAATAGILFEGGAGNDALTGGVGDDWLAGGAGSDVILTGTGNDTLLIDASDLQANLDGGDGFDVAVVSSAAGMTLDLGLAHLESAVGSDGVDNFSTTWTARVILAGNGGNDVLGGGRGGDLLAGGTGNDTMRGNGGNDMFLFAWGDGVDLAYDTSGLDTVEFGKDISLNQIDVERSGADLVIGLRDWASSSVAVTALPDRIVLKNWTTLASRIEQVRFVSGALENTAGWKIGTAGNDVLAGTANDDRFFGGSGNDTLDGGLGADVMTGGLGNDTYLVDDVGDRVRERVGAGTDTVKSTISLTLGVNVENLTLQGSAEIAGIGNELDNVLTGNAVTNELRGLGGADLLDGGLGADYMSGGLGNDTYVVDDVDDNVIEAADQGSDTILSSISLTLEDYADQVENLTLTGAAAINATGNALDNVLLGNAAANRLEGLAGNDMLDGGAGNDEMVGGTGNDSYTVSAASDVITEAPDEGTDTVVSSVTLTLAANVENLTLLGAAGLNGTGNVLDNVMVGNAAVNTLNGMDGGDRLDGGSEIDTLVGGLGNDTYVTVTETVDDYGTTTTSTATTTYASASGFDTVTEAASGGIDTVETDYSYALSANLENLTLTGSAAVNGTGNAANNLLIGNSANNSLNGAAGADQMRGGQGNDTYTVDDVGDAVAELPDQGVDLVQSSVTFTLSDGVENLTLTGTAAINGTGNILDNVLIGNAAINTLTGGDGNDNLNGGAGADTMIGGAGDDTYVVDTATDIVIEADGQGTDTVLSGVTFALSTTLENLTLTGTAAINGTGNALDNVLVGNTAVNTLSGGDGNDSLNGGAGADTMVGGTGDDTYYVDVATDIITEVDGGGADSVISTATYTLAATLENLTLAGTGAINGTGNALNNTLIGNTANNSLTAGGGNDVLDGGVGTDTMVGGAGDDTCYVNATTDVVTELTNEGADSVLASATYTLSANVETLTLIGTAAINGTGNTSNNILAGNIANNILSGGAGADAMSGGQGNDTYVVDNAGDTVAETIDEGVDLVQAGVVYTLPANVENLTLTGTAAISGTGNELDNLITGNAAANALYGQAGNDVINGGAGADTMAGGQGDDTYCVDTASDVINELDNEGMDTVSSTATYTLALRVENLTLGGASAISGTGNLHDNVLIGNGAVNALNGLDGNDRLDGGSEIDTLSGGLGDDTYVVP